MEPDVGWINGFAFGAPVFRRLALMGLLLLGTLFLPACKKDDRGRDENTTRYEQAVDVKDSAIISALVTSEETCLKLNPKLGALSKGLLNLRLPGPGTEAETVFAPSVTVSDLGPPPSLTPTGTVTLESRPWPVATDTKEVAKVDLWRPMLDVVSFFDHARIH